MGRFCGEEGVGYRTFTRKGRRYFSPGTCMAACPRHCCLHPARYPPARRGPMYLRRPDIADIVVGSIHKGAELGHYELHAYVVMGNHVHLLIKPVIAPVVC